MKKLLFIPVLLISICLNAQVFNTSSTLKRGQFSAGFEPGIYASGSDAYIFLLGGVGITSGVDLGVKIGTLNSNTYIGADVEFEMGKRFSISAGAHSWGNFGLDGTALFTVPIKSSVKLFTGLDLDINLDDDISIPLWVPLGLEIGMSNRMAFIFESEICLTNVGSHWIGGGLNFYF
ncbi:MAG: hypothetical protein JXP36_07030 [Bacteroidales bacterium]|nr:hypothetical protein [Bacteroidales bacterium]